MAEPVLRILPDLKIATLTVDVDRRPHLRAPIEAALGTAWPEPTRPSGAVPTLVWQGPNDLAIIGAEPVRLDALARAMEGAPVILTIDDAGWVALELTGEGLDRLCPFPGEHPGEGKRSAVTRLADLRVTILYGDAIRILVERPHADYLRAWLQRRIAIVTYATV